MAAVAERQQVDENVQMEEMQTGPLPIDSLVVSNTYSLCLVCVISGFCCRDAHSACL